MLGDKLVKILMTADPGNTGQVLDQVMQKAKRVDESLRELGSRTPASPQGAATLPAAAAPLPNSVPASYQKTTGSIKQLAAAFVVAQGAIMAVETALRSVSGAFGGFINVNNQMEQLRLQFEVMLGSKAKMEELFTITKKFADTTPFNDLDSYRAGQQLLAAGVKDAREYERSLRSVGDLAAASGRSIGEVASAYARLKSGATGEAMEALRLMNISRAMFEAQGIRFDAGGQALATARQMTDALDSIISNNYGGMTEKLSKTWAGLWSTFTSGAENSVRTLTGGTFELLKSALASVNDAMDAALKDPDQKLKRLGDSITVAAKAVGELGGQFTTLAGSGASTAFQALGQALAAVGFGLSTIVYLTRMAQAAMQLLWDTVSMSGNARQNFMNSMNDANSAYSKQIALVRSALGMQADAAQSSADAQTNATNKIAKAQQEAAIKAAESRNSVVAGLKTIMAVQESAWAVEKAKGRDTTQLAQMEMEQRKLNLSTLQEAEGRQQAAIEAQGKAYQKSSELLAAEAEYAKALAAYYDALIEKKEKMGGFVTQTSKLIAEADAIEAKGGDAGVKRYEALKSAVTEYLDGLEKMKNAQIQAQANAAKMESAVSAAQSGNLAQYQNVTAAIEQNERIFQISALQERLNQIRQLSEAQNLGARERFTLYEQERQIFSQMTGGISAAITETMQQIESLQNKAMGAASSAIGILEKTGAEKSAYEEVASMIRGLNLDMSKMSLQTLGQMASLSDQLKNKGVSAKDLMPNSGQVLEALRKELTGIPDMIGKLQGGLQTLIGLSAQIGAQAANNFWGPWEEKLSGLKEQIASLAMTNLAPAGSILPAVELPRTNTQAQTQTVNVATNTQLTVQGSTLREVDEIVAKARDRFSDELYAALQEANARFAL